MCEPGYMYEDGSPDDIKGLQTSGRGMARALSFLLKENEGIIVELPKQDDYPDDAYGMYLICKHDGCIRGVEYDGDEPDGTMMWID
jgi:hypothetical protein